MVAFAALFKHSIGATALEIGDGKLYVSAEWLQQLCAGIASFVIERIAPTTCP
jgi:hypothetical protein